jgi:hypothetical protein
MQRPRPKTQISDLQYAEIAWADSEERTSSLARRLQLPFSSVVNARRRFKIVGFQCPIHWNTCGVCGKPVAGRTSRHRVHRSCKPRRDNGYASNRYYRLTQSSLTPFDRLTSEVQMASLERLHEVTLQDQELTLRSANRRKKPWTTAEDLYVIEHADSPAREIALVLGRSRYGVTRRKSDLRQRGDIERKPKPTVYFSSSID